MTDSDLTALNFLPEQYRSDSAASINHNYLREQLLIVTTSSLNS